MRFGEVWLNNADGRGGASNFRPSEIVSDATVMVDLGADSYFSLSLFFFWLGCLFFFCLFVCFFQVKGICAVESTGYKKTAINS